LADTVLALIPVALVPVALSPENRLALIPLVNGFDVTPQLLVCGCCMITMRTLQGLMNNLCIFDVLNYIFLRSTLMEE
jgi:hypothetical protein